MLSPPPLARSWFLHSRTFRLGLVVTAFLVWLTVDSFFYQTAYRTIHRGSWRDWSGESAIPAGTPAETGSFVAKIYGGCIFITWFDRLGADSMYYGVDERVRLTDGDHFYRTPRIFTGGEAVRRTIGFRLPTWCLFLTWLGIWTFLLTRSRRRHRAYLAPPASPAS